jgi:hypothetical protein
MGYKVSASVGLRAQEMQSGYVNTTCSFYGSHHQFKE